MANYDTTVDNLTQLEDAERYVEDLIESLEGTALEYHNDELFDLLTDIRGEIQKAGEALDAEMEAFEEEEAFLLHSR